jgi:shikimate 5-dehydrogenase
LNRNPRRSTGAGDAFMAPDATALGAVNTLVVDWNENGRPVIGGDNTDAGGLRVAAWRV